MKVKIFRFLLLMAAFMGLAISLQGCGQSEGMPAIGKNQQAQSVPRGEPESGPENLAELNGYFTDGQLPEDCQYGNKLYMGGENNYYLIDADGDLVRWGSNWDNWDMGWDQCGDQPFDQRNVLVRRAVKYVRGFSASFALDENHDLWAWSGLSLWPAEEDSEEIPSNVPRKIMSSVKDIAAGDLDAVIVLEGGALRLWRAGESLAYAVDVCENVEKVFFTRSGYYCIDAAGNLYSLDNALPDGLGEPRPAAGHPAILETEVADIADAHSDFVGDFLVLKRDGTVELLNDRETPCVITLVAEGAREINGTGFVSADGAYWRVFSDSGEYTGMEKEAHTRWTVYEMIEENSIRILDDGNIEVRFREST